MSIRVVSLVEMNEIWSPLEDIYYRKTEIYNDLEWRFQPEKCLIVASRIGGPIAITRNPSNIVEWSSSTTRMLQIYTAAGVIISETPYKSHTIISMGWTSRDNLCVLTTKSCEIYSAYGNIQAHIVLTSEDIEVKEGKFVGDGFVYMNTDNQFYAIEDVNEPIIVNFPKQAGRVSCWDAYFSSDGISILMSQGITLSIMRLDSITDKCVNITCSDIQISPNGKYVAMLTDEYVHVVSVCLSKTLSEFSLSLYPSHIRWCGSDAVALQFDDKVTLFSPNQETISYNFDSNPHIFTTYDALHVLTGGQYYIIEKVPRCVQDIFEIGSTTPGALLYDAFLLYQDKDGKSYEGIKSAGDLEIAIDTLVECAGHLFDVQKQELTLRACLFGALFYRKYNVEKIHEVKKQCIVLNCIRQSRIAIPLTYFQFTRIGIERLIENMLDRRLHLYCIKICEFIGCDTRNVLNHWAENLIKFSRDTDIVVYEKLIQNLGETNNINFSEIGKVAFKVGRTRLAKQILKLEKIPLKQVPLLLEMREYYLALERATDSQDFDMVNFVMAVASKKLSKPDFFQLIRGNNEAAKRFVENHSSVHIDDILLFYRQNDEYLDEISLLLTCPKNEESFQSLCLTALEKIKCSPGNKTEQSILREYAKLEANRTVNQTVFGLIRQDPTRVKTIKHEFKINDQSFQWILVHSYIETRNWQSLEKMCRETPLLNAGVIDLLLNLDIKDQARVIFDLYSKQTPRNENLYENFLNRLS